METKPDAHVGLAFETAFEAVHDAVALLEKCEYFEPVSQDAIHSLLPHVATIQQAAATTGDKELLDAVRNLRAALQQDSFNRYTLQDGIKRLWSLLIKASLELNPLLSSVRSREDFAAAQDTIEAVVQQDGQKLEHGWFHWDTGIASQDGSSIRVVYHEGNFPIHSPHELSRLIRKSLHSLVKANELRPTVLIADSIALLAPSPDLGSADIEIALNDWFRDPVLEQLLVSYVFHVTHYRHSYCPTPHACPQYYITIDFKKSALALALAAVVGAVAGGEIGGYELIPIVKGILGAEIAALVAMVITMLKQAPEIQTLLTYFERRWAWPAVLRNRSQGAVLFALNLSARTDAELQTLFQWGRSQTDQALSALSTAGLIERDEHGRWKPILPLPELLFVMNRGPDGKCKMDDGVLFEFVTEIVQHNLRKSFGTTPPSTENDVQRSIATILSSGGLEFQRESPEFQFSAKRFRPDLSCEPLLLALEVKLINSRRALKRVVEEIAADITSYSSRFRRILFVVYDIGIIEDQWQFIESFRRSERDGLQVDVLVVKH